MAIEVEVIVKRSMGRSEFLQVAHPSKSRHRPLSSPKRQMTVFDSVVEMTTDLLAVPVSNLLHRGPIGAKSICDDAFRSAISLHGFLQKGKYRLLIPGFGHIRFQHFAFMIDGPPEIMLHAVYLHENFINVESITITLEIFASVVSHIWFQI